MKPFDAHSEPEVLLAYFESLWVELRALEALSREMTLSEDMKRRTKSLQRALGVKVFVSLGDPWIDKWEAELAAGIIPDLDEDEP